MCGIAFIHDKEAYQEAILVLMERFYNGWETSEDGMKICTDSIIN